MRNEHVMNIVSYSLDTANEFFDSEQVLPECASLGASLKSNLGMTFVLEVSKEEAGGLKLSSGILELLGPWMQWRQEQSTCEWSRRAEWASPGRRLAGDVV